MIITHLYHPPPGQRLALIGLPGAGKTTLARQLCQQLALPHIELDAFYWGPNWTKMPIERFRQDIAQAINRQAWLVEGNHGEVYNLIWKQADTLVWLDLSLPLLTIRLLKRTMCHFFSQAELWNGNREEWGRCFLSSRSIFLRPFKNYHGKRQAIKERLNQPHLRHLRLIHLRSPQAVQTWLASLSSTSIRLANCIR